MVFVISETHVAYLRQPSLDIVFRITIDQTAFYVNGMLAYVVSITQVQIEIITSFRF